MVAPAVKRTQPGTKRLSEVTKHLVLPKGIVSTGFPAVQGKCRQMGVVHDEWQAGLLRCVLAKRSDGLYAAGISGVLISIARQVGKTLTIGSLVFALCLLQDGLKVVWTAHRTRTSDETFKWMQGFAKRKLVKRYVQNVRLGNGQQEIEFVNGSRILFGAREAGFGRGFDDVDVVVFDEAQILTEKALDDMVPTTNVSENPLIIMLGTPPKPTDPSEVFTNRRNEALKGLDDDLLYVEIGADDGCDPDDERQWAKGNPSFPHRTSRTAILRLRKQLGLESFLREGLGVWDEATLDKALIQGSWWQKTYLDFDAPFPDDGIPSYGVRFSADGAYVALAGAMKFSADDPIFVELIEFRSLAEGIGWLTDFLVARWRKCSMIVIDGKSDATALYQSLRRAGVSSKAINFGQGVLRYSSAADAFSTMVNAVRSKKVWHTNDPGQRELDLSVSGSKRRKIGTAGAYGFTPISDESFSEPIEAVALARYAADVSKRKPAQADQGYSILMQ